mmetsp:Transcript_23775/g.28697  ORF Transcript_23775/g.28697 Transcript_23775/m.28697 type:complete len:233 (-) Transcript_23775:1078-1776(-)
MGTDQAEASSSGSRPPPETVLSITNLSCQIPCGEQLFAGVNFSAALGETVFIQAPSGSGKTLLLKSIAGLQSYGNISGSVKLEGKTSQQWGVALWRTKVSYLWQQRIELPGTPDETLAEILSFSSQEQQKKHETYLRPTELLRAVGLQTDVLTREWRTLSGGEYQRVALVLCLALKPEVVLLDEPTSGVDEHTTLLVESLLQDFPAVKIWVSHSASQIERIPGLVVNIPGTV